MATMVVIPFTFTDVGATETDNGRTSQAQTKSDHQLYLACPFCKNNPRRHINCFKYKLRDISRLK